MSRAEETSNLREFAREEPEAFRNVAEMADDDLRDRMLAILDDAQDGGREHGDGR